jgi:hypothetical protein
MMKDVETTDELKTRTFDRSGRISWPGERGINNATSTIMAVEWTVR